MQKLHFKKTRRSMMLLAVTVMFVGSMLVIGLLRLGQAHASVSTLTPSADTYVLSTSSTTNFGTDTVVKQSAASYRGLVRFDTSSVPAGSTINSVTLRLYSTNTPSSGGIRVHPELDGWTETGTTWATQPTWDTTVLATSAIPAANTWLSINLPVSSVTVGGNTTYGFDFSVSGFISAISSREGGNPPQLIVNYGSSASAPTVTTGGVSGVTANGATIAGSANANGADSTCRFDYGPTTSYGSQTAVQNVTAGSGTVNLTATLSGLSASTNYNYRLECTNSVGTTLGANGGFTTTVSTTKPVYAIYYLWWSNLHWHDKLGPNYPYTATPSPLPATLDSTGCGTTNKYTGNQLTDVSQGLAYDQDLPGVIENDVRLAAASGLSGFAVNWKGDGTTSQTPTSIPFNRRLQALFDAVNKVNSEGIPFKLQLNYQASATILSTSYIINDLNYFRTHYGTSPALDHRLSTKPEVSWAGSWKYSNANLATVSAAIRPNMYMIGDEKPTSWDSGAAANFDADSYYWSTQDPYQNPQSFSQLQTLSNNVHSSANNPDGSSKKWISPVAPGYNGVLLSGSVCVPRNNGDTLRQLFAGNKASDPDAWYLISWNEIAEGSYIVPLTRYGNLYESVLQSVINDGV